MAYDGTGGSGSAGSRRCWSRSSVRVQQTEAAGWHLVAPVCAVVSTPSVAVLNPPSTLGTTPSMIGLRSAAAAASARQRLVSLSDAVSLHSNASSSRLVSSASHRDIGPKISGMSVLLPKSSVSRDIILGRDSPWSGPGRYPAAFAASEVDISLESLVRALPPPLPPPVLLQRSPPSSLEDSRKALEPTTLIQTCSGVSGKSSAYVQQPRVSKGVTGRRPVSHPQSVSTTTSYNGFSCNKPSENQVSKEISTKDKGNVQEDLYRTITCKVELMEEDEEDNLSGVARGSAPDVERTLFDLISCMTKSLGVAGHKKAQRAAGDAPHGLQRAAAVAAAAAVAITSAATGGVPVVDSEGEYPPFVFLCDRQPPVAPSPSLTSLSGHGTEEALLSDEDTNAHGEETKNPSQTLSELLRAISKKNEEGRESNGGTLLHHPPHVGRGASRSRGRGKQRSSAPRGHCDAHARHSRGRSSNAAARRGLSRDHRRRSRAARRTSAELRRRKHHKDTVGQGGCLMEHHEEKEAAPKTTEGVSGADESHPPTSYADVLDRLARQDSSPVTRGRRTGYDKRIRIGGAGSRKVNGANRRGLRAATVTCLGAGSSSFGDGGGGASSTGTAFSASGRSSSPRLPGGSLTPRPGTRLEAAVAAAIATGKQMQGGRIGAGTPPAPPPSPASSKRSAVAAYACNPAMLAASGDAVPEPGDCSEDSLAFWLRLICGPRRDGGAVDSLVRSQQKSTLSPRKCALGAAKTILARADPPKSVPTQLLLGKVGGGQRRVKLPVYQLPKGSPPKGTPLCGAQPPQTSPPLVKQPPAWVPQCALSNKPSDGVRPKRAKCASKSNAVWNKSVCVHCPTCGMCAHAIQAAAATAQRCSCKSCCTAPRASETTCPGVAAMEWTATTSPRPPRRKARANAVGPAATFASTPSVSCDRPDRLRTNDNMTSGMGRSLPLCLAQWCTPHPSLASSPSFVTEVARAHGCAIGDQRVVENLPRCYRSLGEKGDGAASTPAGCFGDGLTERARRKAWMRSLAKRRSWLCGRVSAHALLARTVHRRVCPKGQALPSKQATDSDRQPDSKENEGEPSSGGRESPRREASSAPLLAREVGAPTRRLTRDRRTPPTGAGTSAACAGVSNGGAKRRRVRCAFTSSPLPDISVHPGTNQLVSSFPPFSSPRYPYSVTPVVMPSQPKSTEPSPLMSRHLSLSPVASPSPSKAGGAGRSPNKRVSFQRTSPSHGATSNAGSCHHGHHSGETSSMGVGQRLRTRDTMMVECNSRRGGVGNTPIDRVHFRDADSSQRPHPPRIAFRDSSPHPKHRKDQSGLKDADGPIGTVPRSILWQTGKRGGRHRGGDTGPASSSVRSTSPFSASSAVVSSCAASTHPSMFKRTVRQRKVPATRAAGVHHDRQACSAKPRTTVVEPLGWARTADRQVVNTAASIGQKRCFIYSRRSNTSEKSHVKAPSTSGGGGGGGGAGRGGGGGGGGTVSNATATTPLSDHSTPLQRSKSRATKTPVSSEGRSVRGSDVERSDKSKRQLKMLSPTTSQRTKGSLTARDRSPDSTAADSSKSSRRRVHRHTASSRATSSPDSRADSKHSDSKRSDRKHSDSKRSDSKHSDSKRTDSKRSDSKRSYTKRPENKSSETKLCDSIRPDSKRASPEHSGTERFDHRTDTKHCNSNHSMSTHFLGETEETIALDEKKSLLQLFFHGDMYSSLSESEKSTSDKESPGPPLSRQPYLIETDDVEGTDSRRDDMSGYNNPSSVEDSPSHTVFSNLLTKTFWINVEYNAGDNTSLKESDQLPIHTVMRVSQHRKLHRAQQVAKEYTRSILNEYASISLEDSSDFMESNDISTPSRMETTSVMEISINDTFNSPKTMLNFSKINVLPVTSPNALDTICSDVDNYNKSNIMSDDETVLRSSTVLNTIPESRINVEEIPPPENISHTSVSKNDEVVSDESDKRRTASTLLLDDSVKDNTNCGADLKNDDQVEFTLVANNSTTSDHMSDKITEQITTNTCELKEACPPPEEERMIPNTEIEEQVLDKNVLVETKSVVQSALAPDALRQLPQASRTTLVTTWNACYPFTHLPAESERESTLDTYSLVCSRSTPSMTESRRDAWIAPSSSSSFSSVSQEEQKLHVTTRTASAHDIVAGPSEAALSATSLAAPSDDRGVECGVIPEVFESTDSFGTYFIKYAPRDQESDSKEELKTAECSVTKMMANENVRKLVRLERRDGRSPGYAFAINDLYCSSDDSEEEIGPAPRQSVCLVLSSSTFSQTSDASTVATDSTLSGIGDVHRTSSSSVRETLHSPLTRSNSSLSGMYERSRYCHRPVTNAELDLGSNEVEHCIEPYSQHRGRVEDVNEVVSWVSNGDVEDDVCVRPPSQEARSSVATSELSHGDRSSLTLLVCDSEGSHTDADASITVDGDAITLLMLEPEDRTSRRLRCMRGAGLAPDLVSDLPAPSSDMQHQRASAGRGRARLRALLEEVQQLQEHKRPESAPASGAELTVTAERLVSGSSKVRDRIYEFNKATAAAAIVHRPTSSHRSLQITNSSSKVKERILAFNTGRVPSEEVSSNATENYSECMERIPSLEETDILGESMKREFLSEKKSRFTVYSLASDFQMAEESSSGGIQVQQEPVPVLPPAALPDATLIHRPASTPGTDRPGGGVVEDRGFSDGTMCAVLPTSTKEARVLGEGGKGRSTHPRAHSRAVSALVATLAAAYLWYNMYVS